MLDPKAKPILLVVLAIALAAAGCGGGDDSATTSGNSGVTTDAAPPAETKQPTAEKTANTAKSAKQPQKDRENQKSEKRPDQAAADDLARKLAKSGKPVPADSPVAQEILESLGEGKSSEKGKKQSSDPVAKAVEEVLTEPQGGEGNPGTAEGDGVEKILEQLQE